MNKKEQKESKKTQSHRLDPFQILKQGTSFSHKEKKEVNILLPKRKLSEDIKSAGKRVDIQSPKLTVSPGFLPLRKRSSSFSGQKYNPSDSEPETEFEEELEFLLDEPASINSKRKSKVTTALFDKEKKKKESQQKEKVQSI
jgi:hypothetical protein